MFYTGIDPFKKKPVFVPTDYHEKRLQRALLQFAKPENAPLVREALRRAHREDLIGFGAHCLVRPEQGKPRPQDRAGKRGQQYAPNRGRKQQDTRKNGTPAKKQVTGSQMDAKKQGKRPVKKG